MEKTMYKIRRQPNELTDVSHEEKDVLRRFFSFFLLKNKTRSILVNKYKDTWTPSLITRWKSGRNVECKTS